MEEYLRSLICSYAQKGVSVEKFNEKMLRWYEARMQKLVQELVNQKVITIQNNTISYCGDSLITKEQ